ncbi:hypothetical protein D3C78_1731480 [compost metagenome]
MEGQHQARQRLIIRPAIELVISSGRRGIPTELGADRKILGVGRVTQLDRIDATQGEGQRVQIAGYQLHAVEYLGQQTAVVRRHQR